MMAGMDAGSFPRAELLERVPEMIVVVGGDLRISYVNQRLLDVMGYEREAVIGSNIFDYAHPDDHDYLASTWGKRAANPGETGMFIQIRGRNADGSWRAVEALGLSLLDDGVVKGMVMTLRDLTMRADRGDTSGRFRAMLDRTTDIVFVLDREGRVEYANRRLTSTLGIDNDEVVGGTFTSLKPPEERGRFDQWFGQLVAAGDRATAKIRLLAASVDPSAAPRTLEWHGTNQLEDPMIQGVILSGRDVTDLVDLERRLHAQTEELRHSAGHDSLTGLLNRSAFTDAMANELRDRGAAGDGGDVVLLFCDLDRFKLVNDTYGHAAGDHVLRVEADRLRACVRDGDVVARWGGDEFTVLLHGSPTDLAVDELVVRLRERLSAPISNQGTTAAVGATVGVSRAAVAEADAVELLRAADEAMYARKTGRGGEDRR